MHRWLIIVLLALPLTATAEDQKESADKGGPLFMKDMLDGQTFFDPWGLGIDFFTMKQDYSIKTLEFDLPGVDLGNDASNIGVRNELQHYDVKFDVWLTPFLNVFALLGQVDATTYVDFSQVEIIGLPFSLPTIPVSYDGFVYGGGLNLVYGTENWFAALNNTWTHANLGGDFDSKVRSYTLQPRLGLIRDKWTFWVGGMYLDTEETHQGTIDLRLPGLPPVPFYVELEGSDKWNTAVGVGHIFSPKAVLTFEYGFGNRDHTLFNFTYRF